MWRIGEMARWGDLVGVVGPSRIVFMLQVLQVEW